MLTHARPADSIELMAIDISPLSLLLSPLRRHDYAAIAIEYYASCFSAFIIGCISFSERLSAIFITNSHCRFRHGHYFADSAFHYIEPPLAAFHGH